MEPNILDALPPHFMDVAREMAGRRTANDAVSAAGRKKRKGKNKKTKGDVFQRCKAQAADLRIFTEISCGDDLECQEPVLTCLGPLESCDFTGFFQCLEDQVDS
jgi:hypothetical protein